MFCCICHKILKSQIKIQSHPISIIVFLHMCGVHDYLEQNYKRFKCLGTLPALT